MVVGISTTCVDRGAPMTSCAVPAHCGCDRVEEMKEMMNKMLGQPYCEEEKQAVAREDLMSMSAADAKREREIAQRVEEEIKKLEELQANSRQVGGDHYRKTEGEQHWDRLIRLFGWPRAKIYFIGQITAYIERHEDKNGLEDLEKASHYLQKLIEEEKKYKGQIDDNIRRSR